MQRAGRAGRTGPGKCYRLYTRLMFERELERETPPEILRSNLSNVVLYLKALSVINVLEFDFIDPPDAKSLRSSLLTLYRLGAIDRKGLITSIGKAMTCLPLEPCLSRTVVHVLGSTTCKTSIRRVFNIASMLSSGDVLLNKTPRGDDRDDVVRCSRLVHKSGDHFTYVVFNHISHFVVRNTRLPTLNITTRTQVRFHADRIRDCCEERKRRKRLVFRSSASSSNLETCIESSSTVGGINVRCA